MKQQEIVYRHVACGCIDGTKRFTQLGIAKALCLPLSTVNGAVANLKSINAVRIGPRYFDVIDLGRILLFWATKRKLDNDVIYRTRVDLPTKEIENSMPGEIAFTCYSAYRLLFKETPADYGEVYVYASEQGSAQVKRRFEEPGGPPNLIVLKPDSILESLIYDNRLKHSSVCAAQLFVDLWNLKAWYAKDYIDALSKRLGI